MAWAFAAWPLLILGVLGVDKPDGCSDESWNSVCVGTASCADLADAGVTCTGIEGLSNCATVCASPCCVTTTTTTQTVSSTTVTTVTHTQTVTSVTETTATQTSLTATATSTLTSVTTVTHTHTETSVTYTFTDPPTTQPTQAPTTQASTTTVEPAAVVRLSARAVVADVNTYVDYTTDSRVIAAYKEVMAEISSLDEQWIALQMVPDAGGNITVSYIVTLPYVEQSSGELEPIVPLKTVQDKLDGVTAQSFNQMLTQKINENTGGTYSQKVIAFEQDTAGEGSVSRAHLCSVAGAILLVALGIGF
ncbi:xpot [Symbiodinium pilosum]|uniref:Xpot protein n=1 Tax=Symbiodinium pilosum TaxID=2952 RepID=A0A812TTK9_SYMPI|nr:xpot [Symbiodinium pilosum]